MLDDSTKLGSIGRSSKERSEIKLADGTDVGIRNSELLETSVDGESVDLSSLADRFVSLSTLLTAQAGVCKPLKQDNRF